MTFRTFTLKDFFDRDRAESDLRIAALRPFTTADLAVSGLTFIPLPEAGAPPDTRLVQREGSLSEEQLRLANNWRTRQR